MYDKKAFFSNAAHIWDAKKIPDAGKISTMLALSDIRPGARILDAGCGTGVLAPYLLRYRPKRILGVDFAPGMISEAKKKLKDPCAQFICDDIYNITPQMIICDYCFFYNSFPHMDDPQRLVDHIAGLMAKGGRITVSHTQGRRTLSGDTTTPGLPAKGLVSLLSDCFRPDVIIDNNVLLMVSGVLISK